MIRRYARVSEVVSVGPELAGGLLDRADTPRAICSPYGRLEPSRSGSRASGSLRLRREGQHCRRARGHTAQWASGLGGLLSRVRRPAVCDPSRGTGEQLAVSLGVVADRRVRALSDALGMAAISMPGGGRSWLAVCRHVRNARAPALAAGLNLLLAVMAPPGRAHPEQAVRRSGQRADHEASVPTPPDGSLAA